MAPLVSPFCSPLFSTSLERAGVPAGKQSRPIMAQPYSRWTNRKHARRAKMNGSLSPLVPLSLRSSLFAILRALSLHLGFRHLSLARPRIPGVLRPSDGPYVRLLPVQSCSATLPYTLQRSNVSHGIFCPSLDYFTYLSSILSLSPSFSRWVQSFHLVLMLLRLTLWNYFFLSFRSHQCNTFSNFWFIFHSVIHIRFISILISINAGY